MRTVALPLTALGATSDQTITWSSAMPNATYSIEASAATAVLGSATCAVLSKTTTGCVIRVTAGVLINAGTVLTVLAYG